jgi:hypothetical protein
LPHFHFDVRQAGEIIPDEVGSGFESMDAAVRVAARSTAEIGTVQLAREDLRDVVIALRDECSRQACTVTASLTIDWSDHLHLHTGSETA